MNSHLKEFLTVIGLCLATVVVVTSIVGAIVLLFPPPTCGFIFLGIFVIFMLGFVWMMTG